MVPSSALVHRLLGHLAFWIVTPPCHSTCLLSDWPAVQKQGELDFPSGSDGKASAYTVGDLCWIPELGRSTGEGNGNPLQWVSCILAWKIQWKEEPGSLQFTDWTEWLQFLSFFLNTSWGLCLRFITLRICIICSEEILNLHKPQVCLRTSWWLRW